MPRFDGVYLRADMNKFVKPLPTVEELNGIGATKANLLLLRCLHAGDGMTQQFELYNHNTLRDLCHQAEGILQIKMAGDLSLEEWAEYEKLIADIRLWLKHQGY